MTETISAVELQASLAKKNPVKILDVRRQADFAAEPALIPGAIWHDPEQVATWTEELAANDKIVIYCARGGSVSKSVAAALRAKDLDVCYIEGGLTAWQAAGFDVNHP